MKVAKSLFSLLSATLLFLSCSEDDLGIKRNFGGVIEVNAEGTIISTKKNIITVSDGYFTLESFDGKETLFVMYITVGIGETTFEVGNADNSILYTGKTQKHLLDGGITITDIDEVAGTMSGTFSGTAQAGSVMVSEGTFTDVPYEVRSIGRESREVAKVDGVGFKATLNSWDASPVSFSFGNSIQAIEVVLVYNIATGAHNFNDAAVKRFRYVEGIYSYKATSGSITVTDYVPNHTIKGTFAAEFTSYPIADKSRSLTNGVFEIALN
jgi:hypothetical protein